MKNWFFIEPFLVTIYKLWTFSFGKWNENVETFHFFWWKMILKFTSLLLDTDCQRNQTLHTFFLFLMILEPVGVQKRMFHSWSLPKLKLIKLNCTLQSFSHFFFSLSKHFFFADDDDDADDDDEDEERVVPTSVFTLQNLENQKRRQKRKRIESEGILNWMMTDDDDWDFSLLIRSLTFCSLSFYEESKRERFNVTDKAEERLWITWICRRE